MRVLEFPLSSPYQVNDLCCAPAFFLRCLGESVQYGWCQAGRVDAGRAEPRIQTAGCPGPK